MSDMRNDFEKNILELENVIAKLESGDFTLEESVELFEKGMGCAALCKEALNKAEKKIVELSAAENEGLDSDK